MVGKGSHSETFSWSLQAINKGSTAPDRELPDIGSAPKQTTCLSTSLTKTCNATVGVKFAPDKALKDTARVVPNVAALMS